MFESKLGYKSYIFPIFSFISGCNRTYHGTIGITYNLELHRPKEDKIPYVCLLTFTASGGIHGDLVQVSLEKQSFWWIFIVLRLMTFILSYLTFI